MAKEKFSKREAVEFGWNVMKSNLGFFIPILLITVLINNFPSIIDAIAKEMPYALSFFIGLAFWALSMVVNLGLIKISLGFCDHKKGAFADLFSSFPLFFKYLFGSILYGLIVLGGFLLLVIPGIIWLIQFQFFGHFIVDKKLGPIAALKMSSEITKGTKGDLFLFVLLLGLINLLGALCLLVGLFATIPTAMVAFTFVYRKLLARTESAAVPESHEGV